MAVVQPRPLLQGQRRHELLGSLTDILVADAFFSKYEFVNEVIGMGFRFVGRLRANSYLRYLAMPIPPPREDGRKKSMERSGFLQP